MESLIALSLFLGLVYLCSLVPKSNGKKPKEFGKGLLINNDD